MAVRDDRSDVKQTTTGFRGPLMVQSLTSAKSKFLSLVGLVGSLQEQSFKDFWFSDKSKFFGIDPSRHCEHHCEANGRNALILEYLDADPAHVPFV